MPVTAVRGGIHRCIPRSLPQPRLRLDTASAHRDEMLTATFYCRGADARGQLEARAAQSELRKASDSLRRLLAHEGQDSKETVALIDDATKRLQHLRSRVGKHAELVNKAKEGEEKMAVERERAKTRLDAVEKNIVSCNLERVSILSERDEIRRDILRAKRTLENRSGLPETDDESESENCRVASVRIESMCKGGWDARLEAEGEGEDATELVRRSLQA